LQSFYDDNSALNDYLIRSGKSDKLPLVAPLADVTLRYVRQPAEGNYGTAVPVALAADYINAGESAVVLMGDDFIWNKDGSSEIARLIKATPHGGCSLLAAQVKPSETANYGVIEMNSEGDYVRIVEKPATGSAPSNLINISKYILTKEVIDSCSSLAASPRGEYELPDAVNQFVDQGGHVKVVPAIGQYLDGGSVESWLHANQVVIAGE
jgi:UTP--glucose-1-phosphate uridylyltransferase